MAGSMVGAGLHFSYSGMIDAFQPKELLPRKRKRGNPDDQQSDLHMAGAALEVLRGVLIRMSSHRSVTLSKRILSLLMHMV